MEVADLEGTSHLYRLRSIVIPLVRPAILSIRDYFLYQFLE